LKSSFGGPPSPPNVPTPPQNPVGSSGG
jgi:hypothetical protein